MLQKTSEGWGRDERKVPRWGRLHVYQTEGARTEVPGEVFKGTQKVYVTEASENLKTRNSEHRPGRLGEEMNYKPRTEVRIVRELRKSVDGRLGRGTLRDGPERHSSQVGRTSVSVSPHTRCRSPSATRSAHGSRAFGDASGFPDPWR